MSPSPKPTLRRGRGHRRRRGFVALAAWCAAAFTGPALAVAGLSDGLSFYLPYEDGLKPAVARGSQVGEGAVATTGGAAGQAWAGAAAAEPLAFYPAANLDVRQGTLSMWVRFPADFTPSPEVESFNLFALKGSNLQVTVRPQQNIVLFMTGAQHIGEGFRWDYGSSIPLKRLTGGEWRHLAVTWDQPGGAKRIYVDGQLSSSNETRQMRDGLLGTRMLLGPGADIDEVAIWTRPLTEAEVAALARDPALLHDQAPAVADASPTWTVYPHLINRNYGDSVVTPSQPYALTLELENRSGEPVADRVVEVTLVDHRDRPVGETERVAVTLAAGARQSVELAYQLDRTGFYKVQVTEPGEEGGAAMVRDVTTFAVLPAETPPFNPFFGSHINAAPSMPELARRLGFSENRVHNMTQFTWWSKLQPEPGAFTEEGFDTYQHYESLGLTHFGQWFGTPYWATDAEGSEKPRGPREYPFRWVPTDDEALRAYVRGSLERFPTITRWEMWNEPWVSMFWAGSVDQYVHLSSVIYEEAKSVRPEVRVYAALPDEGPWLRDVLRAGILDHCDGVTIHQYFAPGSTPDAAREVIARVRKHLREDGGVADPTTIPIVNSESGVAGGTSLRGLDFPHLPPEAARPPLKAADAARTIVQQYVVQMADGVETSHYYFHQPSTPSNVGLSSEWATMEVTRTPRPLAVAHAILAHQIGAGRFAHEVKAHGGAFRAYVFDRGEAGSVAVVWAESGAAFDLAWDGEVRSLMGNPLPAGAAVRVGADPVYLPSAGTAPQLRDAIATATLTATTPPSEVASAGAADGPRVFQPFSLAAEHGPRRLIPIDLTPAANMGLVDEVAGDGRGGAADEGPYNDLRMLERGRVEWLGVPFQIGGEDADGPAIVSLRGKQLMPHGPTEATVGVNLATVRGLFFAHAAAWAVDPQEAAHYTVTYDDGQSVTIPIRVGHEIYNWWHDHQPGEESRTVALEHPSPHSDDSPYRFVRIFYWPNPRSDAAIRSVTFTSNLQDATVMVLGVTAAVWEEPR